MDDWIEIVGARHNNLRDVDVKIPLNKLTVITGPSGSGKSSLAIDVLYAEGQRRYINGFSTYARQYLDRSGPALVRRITNLPPAFAVKQRHGGGNVRSTVGTFADLSNYLRLLYARVGALSCPTCGMPVRRDTPEDVYEDIKRHKGTHAYVTFEPDATESLPWSVVRDGLLNSGFHRVIVGREVRSIETLETLPSPLNVLVDRINSKRQARSRITGSLEQASTHGNGQYTVTFENGDYIKASDAYECARCSVAFDPPDPRLFSFNSPLGACEECTGTGVVKGLDLSLVIDDELSIDAGAILPWRKQDGRVDYSAFDRTELRKFCRQCGIPTDIPWRNLSDSMRELILDGVDDWYGIRQQLDLPQYHGTVVCPECAGARLKNDALRYSLSGSTIDALQRNTISDLRIFFEQLELPTYEAVVTERLRWEIKRRLQYLEDVGLGYLSLDRPTTTISGGEWTRINLARAVGSTLSNALYVLDEPTVGLHARDTHKLISTLRKLRDAGNTVVVVEHDPEVIWSANYVIELGPGAGPQGGRITGAGTPDTVLRTPESVTGPYAVGPGTLVSSLGSSRKKALRIHGATELNLQNIDVDIPLNSLVCISGVSGSGKSTLLRRLVYPGLAKRFGEIGLKAGRFDSIEGAEHLGAVVYVDQTPFKVGSNDTILASFLRILPVLSEIFAGMPIAQTYGFTTRTFSFLSNSGRCESCGGTGTERIDMAFLGDITVSCQECEGRRFKPEVLEVVVNRHNFSDVLDLPLAKVRDIFPIGALQRLIDPICAVGLHYLRLGQTVASLSGGEAQRLKIARHLYDLNGGRSRKGTLIILDEPTTGLHGRDIETLTSVFRSLIAHGHSVVLIEHNLDVISQADWIIDLGPEAGLKGGQIVCQGTPKQVARHRSSHTGQALRQYAKATVKDRTKEDSGATSPQHITIRGARENNLRDVDIQIPHDQLVAIAGLSGSGKSTLAFGVVHEEGQRRFLDGLSAYIRQRVGEPKQPDVDLIEGLPPTLAIEQRTTKGSYNSTVATLTDLALYLRLLFARIGVQECPRCGVEMKALSREEIQALAESDLGDSRAEIRAPIIRGKMGRHTQVLSRLGRAGFREVIIDRKRYFLGDVWIAYSRQAHDIDVVVGVTDDVAEFRTLIGRALTLGKGVVIIQGEEGKTTTYSEKLFCHSCNLGLPELRPSLFSFNTKAGACEQCNGTGKRETEASLFRSEGKVAYQPNSTCPRCGGTRLCAQARFVRVDGRSIVDVMSQQIVSLLEYYEGATFSGRTGTIAKPILQYVVTHLRFLNEVGLSYLSLDRRAESLSGGELQRVRLAAQLGADLRGVCYILDEPTIGLHTRDTKQLIQALRQLRKQDNTVIVVEHDMDVINGADTVIELGPGAGAEGGQVIANCRPQSLSAIDVSPTGKGQNIAPQRTRGLIDIAPDSRVEIRGATANNLQRVSVDIPLGAFVCVTGVSGSGKSSLVHDVLYQGVKSVFSGHLPQDVDTISAAGVDQIVLVNQDPIGRTLKSTPATYSGVWTYIRKLFASLPESNIRGYGPDRYSFNNYAGRCQECGGQGNRVVEMGFLPDVYIECDICRGQRFNAETLAVTFNGESVGDVLKGTIATARDLFAEIPNISKCLATLVDLGLGYLSLGQPSPKLSGGEAQRVKLARELAKGQRGHTLYILDEPTTGLHKIDVVGLVSILDKLVRKGNTVVVIEHNLDVIKEADYLIDLGPDGGGEGGEIVAAGPLHEVLNFPESHTVQALKDYLYE